MLKENQLHNYQKTACQYIINNKKCGLFLDMGLGKTISTLSAVNYLMCVELEIKKVLVIGTKRVAENVWGEEVDNWEHVNHLRVSVMSGSIKNRIKALEADADIYTLGRENTVWLINYLEENEIDWPFDMVVIDESSSFKNKKSKRWISLKQKIAEICRTVILTGTPTPNGLIDLWPQIYLLDGGKRLNRLITNFRTTYFDADKTNGHIVYSYKIKPGADKTIHKKISDICISMKADDYIKLPEKVDNYIKIPFNNELKKKYKDFEKENVLSIIEKQKEENINKQKEKNKKILKSKAYLTSSKNKKQRIKEALEKELNSIINRDVTEISALNAAALSNKLLQFCNGAVYDDDKNVHLIHNLKLDALEEIIEAAQGKPILVAYSFVSDKDRIKKRFKHLKPKELSTPQDIKNWNAGKIQLAILHPASGGHGLNLQKGGSEIVWFGVNWSLEYYLQFNARLHRQGQNNTVVIHHIIIKSSREMDVIKALKNKDDIQNSLMESVKATILNTINSIKK